MEVLVLDGFLRAAPLAQVNALFERAPDRSGAATAGPWAAPVKRSRQAVGPEVDQWCTGLVDQLFGDEHVARFAYPQRAIHPMLTAYGPGDEYGAHEDNPLQSGMRTDFSYTLFLSEPSAYGEGELVLKEGAEEETFKPPSGSLVVYRTGTEHLVRRVTTGERRVAVGWLQSCIRDRGNRELLRSFSDALEGLELLVGVQTPAFRGLNRIRNELVRRWAET